MTERAVEEAVPDELKERLVYLQQDNIRQIYIPSKVSADVYFILYIQIQM